jgi:hypothetical protein
VRWFLSATDKALADLERRAKATEYIQFPDTELPPGCIPERGRIGLKIEPTSGITTLYVVRGIRYSGSSQVIRAWVGRGEFRFQSFNSFRNFIQTDLATVFKTISEIRPESCAQGSTRQDAAHADRAMISAVSATPSSPHVKNSDPVLNKLIGFVIRHVARHYGVEIEVIDSRLFPLIHSALCSEIEQTTCEAIIENILGGPIALSSVAGHTKVNLTAGPPIACTPAEEVTHG